MTTTPGDLYAIVPAGGAGTRLWPLSRRNRPKFLLDLTGTGRTLLQQTWDRLVPLAGADQVLVVTGRGHAEAVAGSFRTCRRATCWRSRRRETPRPPSGWPPPWCSGAARARSSAPSPPTTWSATSPGSMLRSAEAVAVARGGYVVTIGIAPDHPSTAYGYICLGDPLDFIGAPHARTVWHFQEKPDAEAAAGYLEHGGYRWNAGMFIARADVLLSELRLNRPDLHAGVTTLAEAWDTDGREDVLAEVWPRLEKVALDYAVAEPAAKSGRIAVIPADFGWDDVGDWASLARLLPPPDGSETVRVLGESARVLAEDADGVVVPAGGRLLAVLGLDDVIVVDTPDAVLVTTRQRAQEVKALVERLGREARDDLL